MFEAVFERVLGRSPHRTDRSPLTRRGGRRSVLDRRLPVQLRRVEQPVQMHDDVLDVRLIDMALAGRATP